MDRMIDFEYSGRPYTAFCPAAAVFDIYEKYGVCSNIAQQTKFYERTREGWDACCWLLAEFARWGEIARRKRGEEPRPMLTVDELLLAPATEADRLQELVMATLTAGFRRDIASKDEDDEVDLVLQNMEDSEKKEPPQGSYGPLTSRRQPMSLATPRAMR